MTEVFDLFSAIGILVCVTIAGYIIVWVFYSLKDFYNDVIDWKENKAKTFEKLQELKKQLENRGHSIAEFQDLQWKFSLAEGRVENLNIEVERYREALIKERDTVEELKKELKACRSELEIYKEKEAEELAKDQERGMLR